LIFREVAVGVGYTKIVEADPSERRTSIWMMYEHGTAIVKLVNSRSTTSGFKILTKTPHIPKWIEEREALWNEWLVYSDTAVTMYVAEFFARVKPK